MDTANPQSVLGLPASKLSYTILYYTHFCYPLALLAIFLASFIIHSIRSAAPANSPVSARSPILGPGGKPLPVQGGSRPSSHGPSASKNGGFGKTRSILFCWLSVGLVATFVGNIINIIAHALSERQHGWWAGKSAVTYVIGSVFLYSLLLISLIDSLPSPSVAHLITWSPALAAELVMLVCALSYYTKPHVEYNSLNGEKYHLKKASQWEIAELMFDASRVLLLTLCVAFYAFFTWQMRTGTRLRTAAERAAARAEREPLLNGSGLSVSGDVHVENGNAADSGTATPAGEHAYGATDGNGLSNGNANGKPKAPGSPAEHAAFYRPTTAPNRSWWEYLQGYTVFFPYLWPSKSRQLQITVVVCFFLLMAQRVINFLVPIQAGKVTDLLAGNKNPDGSNGVGGDKGSHADHMPWLAISLLVVYKFFQGNQGVLGAVRSVLWIPVSQYSYQALSTASFEHVHGLSLDFHLGKRTGEVISALSKGNAINNFLEQVTFQLVPMLVDLFIAVVYFTLAFDIYYGLTIGVVTFWYLYATVKLAGTRAEYRRKYVNASREEDAVKNDSIMSYETVKYFGAEPYEFDRYRGAVQNYQNAEYYVLLTLQTMNITQNVIFMLGLLVVIFIAAYQITAGLRPVGDFIIVLTYMVQLQGPLNFFGTFYRGIQQAMISGERLLELFKEQPSVVDGPNAFDLKECQGRITFEDVMFSYDERKPALRSLSFDCKPGTTTALVGESGGGKSTVFRLLFRFYNEQAGKILLDGHDVRDITIKSARSHIGVVPQDTVLFNDTIMWNLRYANQAVTDEQVFDACRAASIHDKILSFPDGYQTKVGERGLRLSGGEKQRVAIARTILKDPRIIMLDEATAALDSQTEQNVQQALQKLSVGRTLLVIAHRLSTITNADQILVLHAGMVAERGTHHELLAQKGKYYNMWRKQIRTEKAAEEARMLVEAATKLKEDAANNSNEDGDNSS